MNTNIRNIKQTHLDSRPKEKCGIVGVWTTSGEAARKSRLALAALQHRGLESAGISVLNSKKTIVTYKGMGHIPNVLTDKVIEKLGKSKFAIAQNRYGTTGDSTLENAQPIVVKNDKYQISLGHNGNIPDISEALQEQGGGKEELSDTVLIPTILVKERSSFGSWEETMSYVLPKFKGAYCLTILTSDDSLYGIRDPLGIRPLCLGKLEDGWIIASESVALDAVGADFVRDIAPGEIIRIDKNGKLNSYFFGEPKRHQFCIFEYIYFARPDSFINGRRIKAGRERSGMLLGERIRNKKLKPDIVIPVFDSGYPAAKGVAKELQIPLVDAITTSHYIGRTFIQPGQANRVAAVGRKHNVVPDEVMGKKIVVVDDSAIRMTTSVVLARELKKAGASEIYMAFAAPPVVAQCDLGIDMRNKKDLPAAKFQNKSFDGIEKNIAKLIKADEVIYLPIEQTAIAMGGVKEDFYYTPFGGPHPIRDKQQALPQLKRKLIGKPKIAVLISGNGTNLQEIINGVESNDIYAKIVGVISNKAEAFGLVRAKNHKIPAIALPYKGKLADKKIRTEYEKELVAQITNLKPDLIVLSGWMMVLGIEFLKKIQQMQIPIINLHPALMTQDFSDTIQTSRGVISVLRGTNAIKESFEKNYPVSGITIHQVLPDTNFDVGPIIIKSEIRRKPEDTMDSWEKRTHDAEHILLPTAIKRVIHLIRNGIDISKGEFVW